MQNARRPPKPKRPPPPPPPIKEHEGSILPPSQFRDDEEPTSITDRSSKIKELSRALNGHAKSYEVEIQDNLNPLSHFTKTKALVESHLKDLLKTMKGFKFIETLEVTLKKKRNMIQRLENLNIYTKQHISTAKPRPLLMLTKSGLNYAYLNTRYWIRLIVGFQKVRDGPLIK